MLDSLVVNRLLEKQLDEENVEAAVEDRGQGIDQVEPVVLACRTGKD